VAAGLGDVEDRVRLGGLPDASSSAPTPPSSEAIRSSTASTVGLPIRV
jgi:hypothetical protein